jgi:hypothetical protein
VQKNLLVWSKQVFHFSLKPLLKMQGFFVILAYFLRYKFDSLTSLFVCCRVKVEVHEMEACVAVL